MKQIVIDDGTREYLITNQYGKEICRVHFRPGDVSLVNRYKEMRDEFHKIVSPLAEISITATGEAADNEGLEALNKADQNFREILNKLLDSDDAAGIFEKRNPFSSVGGKFFCEVVLEALGQIIREVAAEEAAASEKRVAKYLEREAQDAGQPAADA